MTVREMPQPMNSNTIITTKEQITKVFTEWYRRYNENPEAFSVEDLNDEGAKVSADYFVKLLHEV